MTLWTIVIGNEVMDIGLIRSNLLKKMKLHKKTTPKWLDVSLERLDITSESEAVVNFVVDILLREITE